MRELGSSNGSSSELATGFLCGDALLCGIIHMPRSPSTRGVLIVVGGPQYRVGSHRQYVLMARALATTGVPVMRFDHRGIGDSWGERRDFEEVREDIRSAIDEFFKRVTSLKEVVLYGLCDAASAAVLYASQDRRVSGLVLLNPWVRTDVSHAKSALRHYYFPRLCSGRFWMKLLKGQVDLRDAAGSLAGTTATALGRDQPIEAGASLAPLPVRMREGLNRFTGPVLFVLSGRDLTAKEFQDSVKNSSSWQELLRSERVTTETLEDADHTFSTRELHKELVQRIGGWLNAL